MMQTNETQLFSSKTNALILKIQALLQFNKTKKLVAGFISFIESRPLWQKISIALIVSLPILVTGIALQVGALIIAGICSFICSSTVIALLEYYKKQHEEEYKNQEQNVSSINEELSHLTEELNAFSKDLGHYQTLAVGEKTLFLQKITELNLDKKHLESSLSDLTGRNKVLIDIKDSLVGENQALHTVVAEKIRFLVQKDQRIKELELSVLKITQDKTQLLLELKKYTDLELSLRERITILTGEYGRQGTRLVDKEQQIQQLQSQLASVLGQRRYLVNRIKVKEQELDTVLLSKQNIEQALAQSLVEQERLRTIITELKKGQEQLKMRIHGLNVKLFDRLLNDEKNQKLLETLLNAGTDLQKNNEFLALQLAALAEENQLLTQTVAALTEVEKELGNSKSKMQEVITDLQVQIKEQGKLLDTRKEQLEIALTDYEVTRTKLDCTVDDLASVKTGMIQEVDKLKQTQIILTKLIANLSKSAIKGEVDKGQFLSQLTDLLNEKERSFQLVAADARDINQRLALMSQEFEQCIFRHKRILQGQELYMQQVACSNASFFTRTEPHSVSEPTLNVQPIAVY